MAKNSDDHETPVDPLEDVALFDPEALDEVAPPADHDSTISLFLDHSI